MTLTGTEHFYAAFRQAVEDVAQQGPVLDFGTDFKFRKELAPFRKLLTDSGYYAVGFHFRRQGELRPDIDADFQHLPLRTGSVGGAVAIEVFEHLPEPWRAADELHRVLKSGASAMVTVPFITGYHGLTSTGGYGDYFRYTEDGLRSIFAKFDRVDIIPLGGKLHRFSRRHRSSVF